MLNSKKILIISDSDLDGIGAIVVAKSIFPEIEYDKVDKLRGMDIVFVTTANSDEESRELLKLLGMPFKA